MGVDIAVKFEGEVPQQLLQQADVLVESEPPRAQRESLGSMTSISSP
jgi:hypothetical protein